MKREGALPLRELVSIKIGGAAALKTCEYRKQGRCRKEIRALKNDGAAGLNKKRGCCGREKW